MPHFRTRFLSPLAFALLLGSAGCTMTENYPLGNLSVRVIDTNDVGVQGALLDLYKIENGFPIHWRATASSSVPTKAPRRTEGSAGRVRSS